MDPIVPFHYSGTLQSSKSLLNRALIIKSYFPDLEINGHSDCEDVSYLKRACDQLSEGVMDSGTFSVGHGGTTLRFLMTRLSRCRGVFRLQGDSRLFERPHKPLMRALEQLGCRLEHSQNAVIVYGSEWRLPEQVTLDGGLSSQFASSLLINAWNLDKDLKIVFKGTNASQSYLDMTIQCLQALGLQILGDGESLTVRKQQSLVAERLSVEMDMSSCFALACFAVRLGSLEILNFPENSLQPDAQFLRLFDALEISYQQKGSHFTVSKTDGFPGLVWDLSSTPDLFPVLAVLLTQGKSPSELRGLKTLQHKESDRVRKTSELLNAMGAEHRIQGDAFHILGGLQNRDLSPTIFDPDKDHRMAMAATLAKHMGYPLRLIHPEVVKKSFPDFFDIVGNP